MPAECVSDGISQSDVEYKTWFLRKAGLLELLGGGGGALGISGETNANDSPGVCFVEGCCLKSLQERRESLRVQYKRDEQFNFHGLLSALPAMSSRPGNYPYNVTNKRCRRTK